MRKKKNPEENGNIMSEEFFAAVSALAEEKDIPEEFIYDQFKESIVKAAKRLDAEARKQAEAKRRAELRKAQLEREALGIFDEEEEEEEKEPQSEEEKNAQETENIFCDINPTAKTIRIYRRMTVVEDVLNPKCEITEAQALNYGGGIVGSTVEIEIKPQNLGRLFALSVKNIIRQAISEEEKRKYRKDVLEKDKEVVSATVQYVDSETGDARIEIGKNNLTLFKAEQLPGETLTVGQTIKVYVSVVPSETNSEVSYANLSRREPGLVRRLFELEVPEISDGTVEIVSTSREAGSRTKIAVSSKDENVDPVGACIGPRGQRVNSVIEALCGEKIDIVRHSEKPEEYIAAALAPATVTSVTVDNELSGGKRTCHVVVPVDQLSLAIGNKGQNVRLAARLTGWKIDIKPEE